MTAPPACERCGRAIPGPPDGTARRFCGVACYRAWQVAAGEPDGARGRRRSYDRYRRAVWVGVALDARPVGYWAKGYGRRFEEVARDRVLPACVIQG